jgi:hypothetical protein
VIVAKQNKLLQGQVAYVLVLSGALVYLMMPVFGIGMRILSYSVEKAATIYCTDALSYYSYSVRRCR